MYGGWPNFGRRSKNVDGGDAQSWLRGGVQSTSVSGGCMVVGQILGGGRRMLMEAMVMDTTEQVWTLRYYTRPSGNRKYPVFTVGWLEFVRVKRLRVGDELTFYGHQVRDADGELQMQYGIQVVRTSNVTFQGKPISLDVENFL
ncbi:hypothetical protein LWI29_003261 [Acer saccharum]|uniref:TF-B3 domain-containing protein n=1 Tax=Acer saccharum TaxID=4024 RepID=A0AA39SZH4_ACESA|nr:hypothetical protein LWI29_003261 [Acer saccharum]